MRPRRLVIEIVCGDHFVLEAEVEKLERLFRRLAFEDKEVLHNELLLFRPSDAQSLVFSQQIRRALLVKQVEHSLVVDLEERYKDAYLAGLMHVFLDLSHLFEEVYHCSLGQSYLCLGLFRLIGCSFHREGFARASLAVSEHGGMKTLDKLRT